MFLGKKEVNLARFGKLTVNAVYKGLKLIWLMGNFFTRDGDLFVTKDNQTFEVRED